MWNCRDRGLMSYHKRVLWGSGEKILCAHDQQRSHSSFPINTSNTKQRIHHNNPFCQHLEIISAKAPQKKKKMLHLTARFHLQLQMSTNERQWLKIFGMKGPLKAWIIPQLTNTPVTVLLHSKEKKYRDIVHIVHRKSYGNFISPSFLNGDNVYSLCIHMHLFRVNTLLMNIPSCCIFQLEHLPAIFPMGTEAPPMKPQAWHLAQMKLH